MTTLIKFYRILNLLSIDITIGAIISASFLALLLDQSIELSILTCLGLVVWLIYTIDHLLDVKNINEALSERRRFHQQYFGVLTVMAILVLTVIIILLAQLPRPILIYGLLLTIIVALYFFVHQRFYYLKELLGAILYSGGVLLPSLAFKNLITISFSQGYVLVVFVLTALTNLILFSWFDKAEDEAYQHQSLVSDLGEFRTKQLIWILFVILFCVGLYGCIMMPDVFLFIIVLMIMNTILFIIFYNSRWFRVHDKYRLVGDAIFFIPIILLLKGLWV